MRMSKFTNSALVNLTIPSPNKDSPRNTPISKITIHHFAGNSSIEGVASWFSRPESRASYNYGIGSDGRIVLIVGEHDRCWASSNASHDHQAVVIGVANNSPAPNRSVSGEALKALVGLCVDICRRNGIPELIYDGTPNGSLSRHHLFSGPVCPGPFLQGFFPDICRLVNARLGKVECFHIDPAHIQRMVELAVINYPQFWLGIDSVQWLNELLANAGKYGVLDYNIDNGIDDIERALNVLEVAGIMRSSAYWRMIAENGGLRLLDQVIICIANRCVVSSFMFSS